MDTKEASLNILELALTGESQEDRATEERVGININFLKDIQSRILRAERQRKPDCEPDDKECQAECQQRRDWVIKVLRATTATKGLNKVGISEKINNLLEEYDEIYKQAVANSDFF